LEHLRLLHEQPGVQYELLRQGAIIMAKEHGLSQPVPTQSSSAVAPKLAKNHPPERIHRASFFRNAPCRSRRPGTRWLSFRLG
jgi:hypothetical protein